jgi:peptidyl-prolyl cis-trans isomerase C
MIKKINLIFCVVLILMLFPLLCPAGEQDTILATVGSEKITQGYLDMVLANLPGAVRAQYEKMGKEKVKEKLLEKIIAMKIFAQGARLIKLDEKPEVKFRIQDSLEGMLAGEYIAHLRAGITVDEGEVKEYYEQNPHYFQLPERVKLRHIAVETEEDAQKILASLKEGTDFAEIARERSIHSSKEKGGDLGWVKKGKTLPEIEEVGFELKKGAISDIIQTKTGYHIIKVEDRKEAGSLPLADVEDKIKRLLIQIKQRQIIDEARKKLSEELGVKIFSDKLKDTKKTPSTKGEGE